MTAGEITCIVKNRLTDVFGEVDKWFDADEDLMNFKPRPEAWTIGQILEHISLTNHFLLILITKGARKALQMAPKHNLQAELDAYVFDEGKLAAIGTHDAFLWNRPLHMEPTGSQPLSEVRNLLGAQLAQCIGTLGSLKNGEGILYKTTMTVNGLGKINVYEYLYFLAQHARRHVAQMRHNERLSKL